MFGINVSVLFLIDVSLIIILVLAIGRLMRPTLSTKNSMDSKLPFFQDDDELERA